MRRGQTCDLSLNIDAPFEEIAALRVVVSQGVHSITYSDSQITRDNGRIQIHMSQTDTLSFCVGSCRIQVRALMNDERAYVSNIETLTIEESLDDTELTNG